MGPLKQYIFMEMLDNSLSNAGARKCIMERNSAGGMVKHDLDTYKQDFIENLLVQVLHAIALFQQLEIVHNDLHIGNIFLEYVNQDGPMWRGERVFDADYFEYKIDGTSLYLPACPLIAKIGDWGLSAKYSKPKIADPWMMSNGFEGKYPNFFSAAYDVGRIVNMFEAFNPSNKFVSIIRTWIFGPDLLARGKLYDADNRAPMVDKLRTDLKHVSAKAILTNKTLMKKYLTKPSEGKIIILGEL
jgi:serine/threonine protein kinase